MEVALPEINGILSHVYGFRMLNSQSILNKKTGAYV